MKQWTLPAGFERPARVVLIAAMALTQAVRAETGVVSDARLRVSGAEVGSVRSEEAVPKQENAQAQLKHATGLKQALRGTDGEGKVAARKEAIRAYRAVREYFEGDAKACAEAAFRAGELLRAANEVSSALAEFKIARERGADTPFRVRAMLEVGHLHRRARNSKDALSAYEAVLSDSAATQAQKDDASLWVGHVYAQLGRAEDALRAWQRVADGAEDPLDRVRAWDVIALAWIEKGDLEAAAGALERCRERLAEASAEETRLGERVRSALSSMRAVDELQTAVERRQKEKSGGQTTGKKSGME